MKIKVKSIQNKMTKNNKPLFWISDMNDTVYSTFDTAIEGMEGKFIEIEYEAKKSKDGKMTFNNITEWHEVKDEPKGGGYKKTIEDYRSINLSYALKYAEITGNKDVSFNDIIAWAEIMTIYVVFGNQSQDEDLPEAF